MPASSACRTLFERQAAVLGYRTVAGVDEVGRGSLFGPVYAAAVVLSPRRPIRGLRDSKQLTSESRESLAPLIRERAVAWAVAAVDAFEIDRVNIYQASRLAMKLAVEKLDPPCDYLLVDALTLDLATPQLPLIRGDVRCRSIAAASILAKVERDACLAEWDRVFPQYGLARHKGYFTPEHVEALRVHGPTPLHRFSYAPVRECCPPFMSTGRPEQLVMFESGMAACP